MHAHHIHAIALELCPPLRLIIPIHSFFNSLKFFFLFIIIISVIIIIYILLLLVLLLLLLRLLLLLILLLLLLQSYYLFIQPNLLLDFSTSIWMKW